METQTQAVVIGGGLAGLSAAVRMAERGVAATILEQGLEAGGVGNSRVAGGLVHVAWDAMDADPAYLYDKVMDATDGEADPALARVFSERAGDAVKWLLALGVELAPRTPAPHMRYVMQPHNPSIGVRRDHDRGPDRTMRHLYDLAQSQGVGILLGNGARSLARDGQAWRVEAEGPDGPRSFVTEHVLVADGGFQANREMVARYIGPAAEQALLRATPASTGQGLRMLLDVGAGAVGLGRVYGHMVSITALTSDELWPYPNLDNLCMASVLVDRGGRRFDSRAINGVQLVNELIRTLDPRGFIAICDDEAWRGPAASSPTAVPVAPDVPDRGGHYAGGETLDELADALGLPRQAVALAVDAHNREQVRPPVAAAPLHALRVLPGITFTMGGARIDGAGRVLDRGGAVIPGLYAAGAAAGGVQGGPRGGYVGGLSEALVFGLVAGETMADARTS